MSNSEEFSIGTILAYLYMIFAHMDGEFSEEEGDVITEKVTEWSGDVIDGLIDTLAGAEWAIETLGNGTALETVTNVCAALSATEGLNKKEIINDLIAIAKADGNYDEIEKGFVKTLEENWEV